MPSTEELWEAVQKQGYLVAAQQKEIEALKRVRRRTPGARRALLGSAAVIGVLALSGAVYASSPSAINANVVHACYSSKTRVVVVPKGAVCPQGTVGIAWNQFTAVTASRPLTVTPGVKGSAPNVALTGTVPTARTFTGVLNGDVRGTQRKTTVGAIQGVPVSGTMPNSSQVLGFDGSTWGPVGVYNPLQVALLKWYPANRTGLTVTVGTQPSGVAFDGTHIWVSNQGGGSVSEISDTAGAGVINTVTVGGTPFGMAFDGSHIWVGNISGTVSEIDIATHTVINTVTVGGDPLNVAFDGSHIWATNLTGTTISEIGDTASPSVINTVTVGSGPFGVAFDGSHLWVTNVTSKTVSEVSVGSSPKVINTVTVGTKPEGIAFDGSHIWVANYGSGTASEISDTALPSVVNTITVGNGPFGVAFDGSHIWVSNEGSGTVSEISDTSSPSVMNTVTVGTLPGGLAFDGSHMWVASLGDGTVSIL